MRMGRDDEGKQKGERQMPTFWAVTRDDLQRQRGGVAVHEREMGWGD